MHKNKPNTFTKFILIKPREKNYTTLELGRLLSRVNLSALKITIQLFSLTRISFIITNVSHDNKFYNN